jgi:hypothetical protein
VNKEWSTVRLHSLRFLYLLICVVIGIGAWPEIITPGSPWDLIRSVAYSFYGAYSLLLLLGVALLIPVLGFAGVLAFSVSGRTREFGGWLAVGAEPRSLLLRVVCEVRQWASPSSPLGFCTGMADVIQARRTE